MSEPSVEEIVAHFERHHAQVEDLASVMPAVHVRAIIASWRERGEALRNLIAEAGNYDGRKFWQSTDIPCCVGDIWRARAALGFPKVSEGGGK